MEENSFSSLVAKLNEMSETGETANKHKEIKVIKKAKQEKKHHNPDVNAMANLLESIDESKPNHLLGREKTKSVPSGETDGTTKNANRGKLVGEDIVDEDLIADLSSQFRDLIAPQTAVAEEEPTPEAVGEFADPIIDLEYEHGKGYVFDELVRYLDGDTIKDFVKYFKQNHDMGEGKKKDHDGDGDIDGDDYMAAKDKAIKKAMGKKMNNEKVNRLKELSGVKENFVDDMPYGLLDGMTFTDGHADYDYHGDPMNAGEVSWPEINDWHLDADGNVKPEATIKPEDFEVSDLVPF